MAEPSVWILAENQQEALAIREEARWNWKGFPMEIEGYVFVVDAAIISALGGVRKHDRVIAAPGRMRNPHHRDITIELNRVLGALPSADLPQWVTLDHRLDLPHSMRRADIEAWLIA